MSTEILNLNEMIIQSRVNLSYKELAKWLACIYILVSKAIIPMGYANGSISLAILGVLAVCVLISEKGTVRLHELLRLEIIFVGVTLFTSFFVAGNRWSVINTGEILISSFVFGYCMIHISLQEGGVVWFVKAWHFTALLLCGYVFITGGYFGIRASRLSLREGSNSNTLGVFMVFAIWCSLYLISINVKNSERRTFYLLFQSIAIMMFFYIILETASRKALIACMIIILFWLVFALIPLFRRASLAKRVSAVMIIAALAIFVYIRFGAVFVNASSTLVFRMQQAREENLTDTHRFVLIKDAIRVFLSHPLFGVGWSNFKRFSFSGQHSHNTFAEVIVSTGIVGSLLAFYIWYRLFKCIIAHVKSSFFSPEATNLNALFAAFLFIDMGQIVYYNSSLGMIMHLIMAIVMIKQRDSRDNGGSI